MKLMRALAATLGVVLGLGAWGLGAAPVAADSGHRAHGAST